MTRVSEFDNFYVRSRDAVLQASYAVCGDATVAREATVEAFARAWRQWEKIRRGDPASFVRDEACKLFVVSRGTHLLSVRRRRREPADPELLRALGKLSFDERRLVTLLTVAELDLVDATREMSIDEEVALESTSLALEKLESELKAPIDELERRLTGLSADTARTSFPAPERLRSGARRGGVRNAALLVAACVVALAVGGLAATNGSPMSMATAIPDRQQLGAERPVVELDSHELGLSNLLTLKQVSALDTSLTWTVEGTSTDSKDTTPYSTCPTKRFADPNPAEVFVRAYDTTDKTQRVAQSIEVSHSKAASVAAYHRLISWYANCSHPRTRLIDAFTVKRPFGDFQILRLQSYRSPARFITVGIAQSGLVTSTLIHESQGTTPTDVDLFAKVLNHSVQKVCHDSGGTCSDDFVVQAANPPRTSSDPSYLGVIDLPPIGDIDHAWAAGAAERATAQNPSASPCDNTDFSGWPQAGTRLFVIPTAKQLPETFAIAQTVATAASQAAAAQAVATITSAVTKCATSKVAGKVSDATTISGTGFSGMSWQLTFQLSAEQKVSYRMGIVRRGSHVSQVLFPPAGSYSLSNAEFVALVKRAGSRLVYAP